MTLASRTSSIGFDEPNGRCGLFAIIGHEGAAAQTALGLNALQHRGKEVAGIATSDGKYFRSHRALGDLCSNFYNEDVISKLSGFCAIGLIGHCNPTNNCKNDFMHPFFGDFAFGGLALTCDGNISNAYHLRQRLIDRGCLFQSNSDAETIIHLIACSNKLSCADRLKDALLSVQGAYALIAMSCDMLLGVRDPYGVRSLVIGKLGKANILASETCALDIVGASLVREVDPGELVIIRSTEGLESHQIFSSTKARPCILESVHLARQDSIINNNSLYSIRQHIGEQLAIENAAPADIVIPASDTNLPSAISYARTVGIPLEIGLINNHYIGCPSDRAFSKLGSRPGRIGYSVNRTAVDGKRVALISGPLIRGINGARIISLIRQAGAKEVHMRITSPPIKHTCCYGINIPQKDKLLAAQNSVPAISRIIEADSVGFISIAGLYRAFANNMKSKCVSSYCDACFSGDYIVS